MQFQNAIAELQGVNEPLQVQSAFATLSDERVNVTSFSGGFATGPAIGGTVSFPDALHRPQNLSSFTSTCTAANCRWRA